MRIHDVTRDRADTGDGGAVDLLASNDTDVVIDINGYFAPASSVPGWIGSFSAGGGGGFRATKSMAASPPPTG